MPSADGGLSGPARLRGAWSGLVPAQRRVVLAAVLLLASMFLPWYTRATYAKGVKSLQSSHENVSAISTFTFVEAAIFLVAVGVTLLMLARGERRPFHLPGGDGFIVTGAGAWATFLVFYRFVDQPSGQKSSEILYDYGLHWGIFFGLLAALFLTYCGNALRTAHLIEPPLPGDVAPSSPPPAVRNHPDPQPRPRRRRPPATPAAEQLSFEEPAPEPEPSAADPDAPTTVAPSDDAPTRRVLPFEEPVVFDDDPPEFPPRRRPR